MKNKSPKKNTNDKINKRKIQVPNKSIDSTIKILFIISMVLLIWEIYIFRQTIISSTPLIITMTFIALVTTPLTFKFLLRNDRDLKLQIWKKLFSKTYWKINKGAIIIVLCYFFLNWVVFGGLPITAFILSNYYFAKEKSTEVTVNVLKIDKLNGKSSSKTTYAKVVFPSKIEKELFPPHHIYKDWTIGSNQTIYVQKGLWGYDVIKWN